MEKEKLEKDLDSYDNENTNESYDQLSNSEASNDLQGEVEDTTNDMVEKLNNQINALTAEKDEYLSAAQRIQAEFENYKRRNRNIVSDTYKAATAETIEFFLPVLDNLERALESAKENYPKEDGLLKGINMVTKQFKEILNKLDVEEIEALGVPFDPNLHNAVMQVELEEGQEENAIVEVLQKGYRIKDKIIRHSMVKVAR